jgi:hypothetical protein
MNSCIGGSSLLLVRVVVAVVGMDESNQTKLKKNDLKCATIKTFF